MHNNCEYCQKPFRAKRITRKYCSDNCKQLAYFKRNGMVFGMNGTKEENTVKDLTVKPIAKELYDNTDNIKTVNSVNVKQDQDILRQEIKQNQEPISMLSEKQMQELLYRISTVLDVKLQQAIVNVKEELDVKYASLYGKQDLSSNMTVVKEQVPLCTPVPFKGIARQTAESTVKHDTKINVKPVVKDESEPLTQNAENTIIEKKKHLPEIIMAIPLADDEDEIEEDDSELNDLSEENEVPESEKDQYIKELEEKIQTLLSNGIKKEKENTETATADGTESQTEPQEETEKEYEWVKSAFLQAIEIDFEESYAGDEVWGSSDPNVIWVNEHLRCVIENIVRLSEYNTIDQETLKKLSSALNKIVDSYSFNNLSSDYPFLNITRELAERMNLLVKKSTGEKIPLRINLKTKAKLVSLCYQMGDNVPLLKFNDMTFAEEHSEKHLDNRLAGIRKQKGNKSGSWQTRYNTYVEAGLIEPDDDENEDEEEPNRKLKSKENPYNERIRYFQKHGKFPSQAA